MDKRSRGSVVWLFGVLMAAGGCQEGAGFSPSPGVLSQYEQVADGAPPVCGCGDMGGGPAFAIQKRPGTNGLSFARGQAIFEHEFTLQEGLGPDYNAASCVSCHQIPVVGGAGDLQRSIHGMPRFTNGVENPPPPPGGFSRIAPSLLGLGYIADVPAQVVIANCGVSVPLGIQGKVAYSGNGQNQLARFGHKLPALNLLDFSAAALYREMSLNNSGSPTERTTDGGPDEVSVQDVKDLATFIGGIDRPPAVQHDPAGRAVFENVGCVVCHALETQGIWRDGTDGCGHDLGPALADGDNDNPIGGNRWRTASFIGMRYRQIMMHDGRAATVDAATRMHAGEAAIVEQRYEALSQPDRDLLINYVLSL